MTVAIEEAKWAVRLAMRWYAPAPGSVADDAVPGDMRAAADVDLALSGFSRDISRGTLEERVAAADALGWMLDRRAVSPLLRALGDHEPAVRRAAARSISSFLGAPDWAIDPLIAVLHDADAAVRGDVATALVATREPRAVLAVEALSDDPVASVRRVVTPR